MEVCRIVTAGLSHNAGRLPMAERTCTESANLSLRCLGPKVARATPGFRAWGRRRHAKRGAGRLRLQERIPGSRRPP
eukprot:2862192-Alexandrium_andersonii.AAC.1